MFSERIWSGQCAQSSSSQRCSKGLRSRFSAAHTSSTTITGTCLHGPLCTGALSCLILANLSQESQTGLMAPCRSNVSRHSSNLLWRSIINKYFYTDLIDIVSLRGSDGGAVVHTVTTQHVGSRFKHVDQLGPFCSPHACVRFLQALQCTLPTVVNVSVWLSVSVLAG